MSLLSPGHALGSSGEPSDHMVSAFAVRGWFFNDLWGRFWRPGTQFSYQNQGLDAAIATYSFRMFLGLGLVWLFNDSGMPQNLKNNEIHATVVQNQGSTKQHRKYQLEVPGLVFYRFWCRFWRPGGYF